MAEVSLRETIDADLGTLFEFLLHHLDVAGLGVDLDRADVRSSAPIATSSSA
jgi:hypothetical protein